MQERISEHQKTAKGVSDLLRHRLTLCLASANAALTRSHEAQASKRAQELAKALTKREQIVLASWLHWPRGAGSPSQLGESALIVLAGSAIERASIRFSDSQDVDVLLEGARKSLDQIERLL